MRKLLSNKKNQKAFMTACMLSFLFVGVFEPEVFLANNAAQQDFMANFTSLETLLADLISSIGTVVTLWNISEWGLAWQESNGAAGGHAFKKVYGSMVMVFAPQIVAIIV